MVVFAVYFGLKKVSNKELCPQHPLGCSHFVYFQFQRHYQCSKFPRLQQSNTILVWLVWRRFLRFMCYSQMQKFGFYCLTLTTLLLIRLCYVFTAVNRLLKLVCDKKLQSCCQARLELIVNLSLKFWLVFVWVLRGIKSVTQCSNVEDFNCVLEYFHGSSQKKCLGRH